MYREKGNEMIAYIKGELSEVTEETIVVESSGIGYEIIVPFSVMNQLPSSGNQVKIYTYMYVREDAMKLYGFLRKDDLHVFKLLITVNGIGPKGALGILSMITPDDLRFAVLSDDVKTISKAPGIGLKTAKKLIIELKDKLKLEEAFETKLSHTEETMAGVNIENIRTEAVMALVALGYSNVDALKAVRQVKLTETMTVEELLKKSLKFIMM